MNNLIAESIKRFGEKFTHDPRCLAIEDDNEDCVCVFGKAEDFFKQELTAIAEKTREDTLWEVSTEVHKMTNKYGEGYMAAVVDVKSILASLDADKESK